MLHDGKICSKKKFQENFIMLLGFKSGNFYSIHPTKIIFEGLNVNTYFSCMVGDIYGHR